MECLYIVTMTLLKFAFAGLLLRILPNRRQKYVTCATALMSAVVGAAFMLFCLFQCGLPVRPEKILEKSLGGECEPRSTSQAMSWLHAVINALVDFIFVVLPTMVVWRLQLNIREKLLVALVFVLGSRSATLEQVITLLLSANIGDSSVVASFTRMQWIGVATSVNVDFFGMLLNAVRSVDSHLLAVYSR